MSARAKFWLGTIHLGTTKNDIDLNLIQIFSKSDKKVVSVRTNDYPEQLNCWLNELLKNEMLDEIDNFQVVYYIASTQVIRDRLNLMGYTIETSKKVFAEALTSEIQRYELLAESNGGEIFQEELSLLSSLTLDRWIDELVNIQRFGLSQNRIGNYRGPNDSSLLRYMMSAEWYGFPGPDLNAALRLIIDIMTDEEYILYDITDLVWSEHYRYDEDLVSYGMQFSPIGYSPNTKVVILTEGSTDSLILSEIMKILYPHLSDYYSFMDFETSRVSGGAGNLVNLVKAFIGAGIINRTIAIFDNDTAAEEALRSLERIEIPKNIVIVKLPNIPFLENYPTIGPSGTTNMDINGLASSIELFLGYDVLLAEDKHLTPIQWTGYNHRLGQYQGEVLFKSAIHMRFKAKLRAAQSESVNTNHDWDDLINLFSVIFSAFHDVDANQILNFNREYFSEVN